MSKRFIVHNGTNECGPYSGQQLVSMSRQGSLLPVHKVRNVNDTKWIVAKNVRGLAFPGNNEGKRLCNAYLGLTEEINKALTDKTIDKKKRDLALTYIKDYCCDFGIVEAIENKESDTLLNRIKIAVGHDLLYWAIITILADAKVQREEIESIGELIIEIARAYSQNIEEYTSCNIINFDNLEKFLAKFKKDRSHYGWPVTDKNQEISLDAMLGAPLALAASLVSPHSKCLVAYKTLIDVCISVIAQVDSFTVEEQAIIARANRYFTLLDDAAMKLDEMQHLRMSPLEEGLIKPTSISDKNKCGSRSFRKMSWGMTKQEVKSVEDSQLMHEDECILIYQGSVADLNALIIYTFTAGVCIRAKYHITNEHSNKTRYLCDYDSLRNILDDKYGCITGKSNYIRDMTWLNNLYEDDFEEWGFAISIGHLTLNSNWSSDDTNIALIMLGDNYEITLVVEYSSKELSHLENAVKKTKYFEEL